MILVDTNVWSEQAKQVGDAAVLDWIEAHDADILLSALVIAEIEYGIALSKSTHKRAALERWLAGLKARYWSRTLDFDSDAAREYGRIAAGVAAKARDPQVFDLQIAAQAAARNAAIATRNTRDFAWSGVRVIDPWEG